MAEWLIVNGARIERSFFEENVSEARQYAWERTRWQEPKDHGHCMVCNIALAAGEECYRSCGGWLCPYCFTQFVSTPTN